MTDTGAERIAKAIEFLAKAIVIARTKDDEYRERLQPLWRLIELGKVKDE